MDHKNKTLLWGILFAATFTLHFWPMACWSHITLVLLRVIAAFSGQILFCQLFKSSGLKILPLLLTTLPALWGGWLFFTSPAWADATFPGYILDYCTPGLTCAAVYLENKIN